MIHPMRDELDRRRWLAGCTRGAVLAGIAVVAGTLVGRGQVGHCQGDAQACASCRALPACGLPQAAAARHDPAQEGRT